MFVHQDIKHTQKLYIPPAFTINTKLSSLSSNLSSHKFRFDCQVQSKRRNAFPLPVALLLNEIYNHEAQYLRPRRGVCHHTRYEQVACLCIYSVKPLLQTLTINFWFFLLLYSFIHHSSLIAKKIPRRGRFSKNKLGCKKDELLRLAVRCNDGTEFLSCSPPTITRPAARRRTKKAKKASSHTKLLGKKAKKTPTAADSTSTIAIASTTTCSVPDDSAWAEAKCLANGGFDQVLPIFSGCYPTSLDFWKEYAPDVAALLEGQDADQQCGTDLALPDVIPFANTDFEQEGLGEGWEIVSTKITPTRFHVERRCDDHPVCDNHEDCNAYQGDCFAYLSAGDTNIADTEPNSMKRYDFRVPEIDQTCASQLLQNSDVSSSSEYCFSFAMRFNGKDYFSKGRDDFFQVKVMLILDNGDVQVLFDRRISLADVGDKGDSGWEVHQVQLPKAKIGKPMYFGMEAMVANTYHRGLDSLGMLDDLKIGLCSDSN